MPCELCKTCICSAFQGLCIHALTTVEWGCRKQLSDGLGTVHDVSSMRRHWVCADFAQPHVHVSDAWGMSGIALIMEELCSHGMCTACKWALASSCMPQQTMRSCMELHHFSQNCHKQPQRMQRYALHAWLHMTLWLSRYSGNGYEFLTMCVCCHPMIHSNRHHVRANFGAMHLLAV